MSYETSQLHGIAYLLAECYGKPHFQARYKSDKPTKPSVDRYELEEDAVCIVCGQRATNAHHAPPKGIMRVFGLETERGTFPMRPALLAVCGSGTTGCHGDIHAGLLKVEWVWDDPGFCDAWWDGKLSEGAAHDPGLYSVGFWRITDHDGNVVREVRL